MPRLLRLICVVVVVLVAFVLSSCGGSPTTPTPVAEKPTISPVVVPLPGSNVPLSILPVKITPSVGAQLVVGDRPDISWKFQGPASYKICFRSGFIKEGVETTWRDWGGGLFVLPDNATYGRWYTVDSDTPNILAFRWWIWISPTCLVDREPDAQGELTLNYKAPLK